jgi:hypothetical protein
MSSEISPSAMWQEMTCVKELKEWFGDEEKGNEELKQAEARLAKLKRMEKNLQQHCKIPPICKG